jgi:hypothetical protein
VPAVVSPEVTGWGEPSGAVASAVAVAVAVATAVADTLDAEAAGGSLADPASRDPPAVATSTSTTMTTVAARRISQAGRGRARLT